MHAYKETASHVIQHYKVNERLKECQWKHSLKLETRDRTFQLHCPSDREIQIWFKAFKLIIAMNKKGINCS